MKKIDFRAFTLVELIVVITIIGILSTVGFVSYSGYLTGARDSNRMSQMVKLSDSLQVYSASKNLPLPDDYIEVTASGKVIAYQGYVGVDVLETIDYTNGGADPKDGSYYTYYLTKDRNSMQLLALMEEQQSVAQTILNTTYSADYSNRYPKVYGRKLGILTQVDTNTPIQQLTAYSGTGFEITTETGYVGHISDNEKIIGESVGDLIAIAPKGSCNRIKQTGWASGNGVYTIMDMSAYCDMETSGGGWTLIARSVVGGTGTFTLGITAGSITDLDTAYVFGGLSDLTYSSAMLGAYSNQRIINESKINTTSTADLSFDATHTLGVSGITGGDVDDGYNLEQGMLFVK